MSFTAPQIPPRAFLIFEVQPTISDPFILIVAEPLSKKQKLDYDAAMFTHVNISPSEFSKHSNFQNVMMQNGPGREVYIQNRPIDFESVLLTLISLIFGHLSDDLFMCHETL